MDQPGERRSHAQATPRGGGVSIVVSMLLAMVLLAAYAPGFAISLTLAGSGLALVAGIGWIDDHRPLPASLRLVVHAVAAALLALSVLDAGGGVPGAVGAFIAAMVLVNVWNFMDGIDSLAASQALLVALGCVLFTAPGALAWFAMALAAATAGFLPFNLPRARIFLGDVGSGALGFGMAVLVVGAWLPVGQAQNPWLLLLPLTAFLIDASLTLGRRMLRRERWWEPHVQHAYQVCSRRIGRHGPVAIAYGGWTLAMVTLMLTARSFNAPVTIGMIVASWLAGGAIWLRSQDHRPPPHR
ncbi:lipopolysaccharide biosynthesis protein [Luteimonas aestuarii]|uniref:Lipopolysaccharide biosynthesis protein n=2 Tax=Luteimonas aestuarii TaxID=453837 RepID=A0A4R5TLN6_9GAMM|nr:lipopolysaccharide biosynthesis protein [Luteimonas aestuarii]